MKSYCYFYLIASFSCLLSHVTLSRSPLVCNIIKVTEIHSLYKFGAISFKQYQVIEVFVPKPRFHVGDLRHVLKSQ